jgi:predicted MFS family arabinose efflux permease
MMVFASVARPVITVYQQEIVESTWQPAMSGATTMAAGLSFGIMSFGGGYLITVFGYPVLFLIGAILTALGAVLFWIYHRTSKPKTIL